MKLIEVSIDCKYKDKYLDKGDIIEPTKENLEMIDILNQGGFINPLSRKEMDKIKKFVEEEEHATISKKN